MYKISSSILWSGSGIPNYGSYLNEIKTSNSNERFSNGKLYTPQIKKFNIKL